MATATKHEAGALSRFAGAVALNLLRLCLLGLLAGGVGVAVVVARGI